ncbi:efflux transporter outer membrane subunit [Cupriavidus gilardii]|uniref:Efflux transporter outer membrane subunit n=1 Tax=Cupriavidus gilardii TaxID=82541 RepID=A0A6N1BJX0_9BURK|nr:efflux transporter outer membrane subunit [Cupriavidus gilardii]ALD92080.1 outer membrane protein, multidrug efflux system [Cupriavidus gilardii CR3]QQE06917.1 efflux transporter outer membrane subunit [Cupriavidus sp. ISTL7]KAB0595015.1 efflux transporter outer membrane subunit [Cupriavidus gilardii]MCT9013890.1 efflux transporter outer membrane subunit [Cupriavidus gilardii]MCT9052078.1 efflux transporter outer membrane subunit [Cupriavidus gilardii]
MTKTLTALLLVAGVLSGCTLAPRYERPAAPVAAEFPTATEGYGQSEVKTGESRRAADIGWREFFRDARLQAMIETALNNNRDLRTAALRIEEARALYQVQRADLLPTVNATGGYTRQQVSGAASPSGQGYTAGYWQAGGAITSYELDFFGRVRSLSNAALAQYFATEEARRAAQISLVSEVAKAYLAERAYDEQYQIAQNTLKTREETFRLAQQRFEAGATSALDLRDNESLVAQARVSAAELARQRAQARNALEVLVGTPLGAIPNLPPPRTLSDERFVTDIPPGLPSDLLEQRPDIRQAEQQLLSANANIGAARAAFFPRISLTTQLGSMSRDFSGLFEAGTKAWSFAPQLVLPIFDFGRNMSNLDLANVRKNIQVANYEKTIQVAFREVADALVARGTLEEQVASQEQVRNAEAARFELANLRFRSGITGQLETLDAQRQLFTAEQALIQARQLRLNNAIDLYRALGGGLSETGPVASAPTPQNGTAR